MKNRNTLIFSLTFIAFVLFIYHIGNFPDFYFDETHYLKAALDWIQLTPTTNLEHPPLGKLIIASGIKLYGQNPFGFRMMNVFSGTLIITFTFLIAEILFIDLLWASFVTIFSLLNFWIYINSRIAMLDIFLVQFYIMAIYFYLAFDKSRIKRYFWLSSFFWGIAVAIKWSGVFLYFPFISYLIIHTIYKKEYKKLKWLIGFGIFSICIYFLTFSPYMFTKGGYKYNFYEIVFKLPFTMLELQSSVPAEHPYASSWFSWVFMLRPIWYEFKQFPITQTFRGVILLGNPVQMFIGFVSVVMLTLRINRINHITRMLLLTFLFSWMIWGVLPRKVYFFYYFFPMAMLYSFLFPMFLKEFFSEKEGRNIFIIVLILSLYMFWYFFPVISGDLTPEAVRLKWYWFKTWI